MKLNLMETERSTYTALDWIGDLGGCYDGLRLVFLAIFMKRIESVAKTQHKVLGKCGRL